MSLMARRDRVLLGGLAVALFVARAKPIRYLLELARAAEERSGLPLTTEIDAQAVIDRADAAPYRANEQGRNGVRLSIEPAVA